MPTAIHTRGGRRTRKRRGPSAASRIVRRVASTRARREGVRRGRRPGGGARPRRGSTSRFLLAHVEYLGDPATRCVLGQETVSKFSSCASTWRRSSRGLVHQWAKDQAAVEAGRRRGAPANTGRLILAVPGDALAAPPGNSPAPAAGCRRDAPGRELSPAQRARLAQSPSAVTAALKRVEELRRNSRRARRCAARAEDGRWPRRMAGRSTGNRSKLAAAAQRARRRRGMHALDPRSAGSGPEGPSARRGAISVARAPAPPRRPPSSCSIRGGSAESRRSGLFNVRARVREVSTLAFAVTPGVGRRRGAGRFPSWGCSRRRLPHLSASADEEDERDAAERCACCVRGGHGGS